MGAVVDQQTRSVEIMAVVTSPISKEMRPGALVELDTVAERLGITLTEDAEKALQGIGNAPEEPGAKNQELSTKNSLLLSAIEHPSIRGPAAQLARSGWQVDTIPVDRNGRINVATVAAMLQPTTRLVFNFDGTVRQGQRQRRI